MYPLSCLDDVLRTVLTLYMENEDLPLPTLDEVLICNQATTAEEVNIIYIHSYDVHIVMFVWYFFMSLWCTMYL